jgi:hypothetical protein
MMKPRNRASSKPFRGEVIVGPAPAGNFPQPPGNLQPAHSVAESAADLVGGVFVLGAESGSNFVSLPADESALKEKEKLEAANDDLGLSLLFAARKIFLVPTGTRVKVLKAVPETSSREVRILEGEFTGETALAPLKCLIESARSASNDRC